MMNKLKFDWLILPLAGVALVVLLWHLSSKTWAKELPSPAKTWAASKQYVLKPFEKRGEMDHGIRRITSYTIILRGRGYAIALLIGTPMGSLPGLSRAYTKPLDPII